MRLPDLNIFQTYVDKQAHKICMIATCSVKVYEGLSSIVAAESRQMDFWYGLSSEETLASTAANFEFFDFAISIALRQLN